MSRKVTFYEKVIKRCIDFIISLLALITLSPIFIIVYLLSLIFLGGNPIFKQYRPGKDGKLFPLLKFRSMTNKKDKDGNLLPDKDRITTWGKIIRKLSLDELPQLLNILCGHMAIVGPRPRLVKDMIFYDDEVLKLAYSVRPGLTGPAQVYDRNSELSWESVFERDIEYAKKITFIGDLKLFLGTFLAVFKGGSASGAEENSEKREYYYADQLLKGNKITKEQYDLGLSTAKELEAQKRAQVSYVEDLHNEEEVVLPTGEAEISVLMSVYKNDTPDWLQLSIESIINQTLKPNEIILFVDGPVGDELNSKIEELAKEYSIIKLFRNEENIGLGKTLEKGIMECKNEIVARMDSDDYSIPTRFAEQYKCMMDNDLDLVGSDVSEFIDDIENIIAEKKVPSKQKDILNYAKTRNPFNHPTVMFKKSKVLEVGNYQDMKLCEDYYLWVRMLQGEAKVFNISKPLVCMRVSEQLYARRGGLKYYKNQKKLLKYMRKSKFIGFFTYTKSKMIRFAVQVLMPNKLRQKLYVKKLRKV